MLVSSSLGPPYAAPLGLPVAMLDGQYLGLHALGKYVYVVVLGKVVLEEPQEAIEAVHQAGVDQSAGEVHHPVLVRLYRELPESDEAALRNGPRVAFPGQTTNGDGISISRYSFSQMLSVSSANLRSYSTNPRW